MPENIPNWVEPTTVAGAIIVLGMGFLGLLKSIWTWIRPRLEKAVDGHLKLMGTLEEQSIKNTDIQAKNTEIQERNNKLQEQSSALMGQMMTHQTNLLELMRETRNMIQEHHQYAVQLGEKLAELKPPSKPSL